MSIYLETEETKDLKCSSCGEGWEHSVSLYGCDSCNAVVCEDCLALTDIDCPNEFCMDC